MSTSRIANVLDTEATCYENGVFPAGEVREIIEFGITTVNLDTRKIVQSYSIPILPVSPRLSPYCTELTGWTHAALMRSGVPFATACRRILNKYGGRGRLLVTDSDNELDLVRLQCASLEVEFPFGQEVFNVSTMLALLTGSKRKLALPAKLALLGLQPEGRLHRADSDSRNIARLLLALMERGRIALPTE